MKIYVISDTHFYHQMLIDNKHRPKDYQYQIINNWKHTVTQSDVTIHLGDVCFYKKGELKSILNSIPGKKWLTLGNHDRLPMGWYLRNGFDFVGDEIILRNCIFTHKPKTDITDGQKGYLHNNIFGHLHDLNHRGNYEIKDNNWGRLFSLEFHKYRPIELTSFLNKTKEASWYHNKIDETKELRETY